MDVDPGQGLHYLDNASTTFPKSEWVIQAMAEFWSSASVNPGRSTFDLAMVAENALLGCRQRLTDLFNGPAPERVVLGYNATDALNLAIFGRLARGGHVVTTRLEHNSVLRPIAHAVDDLGARVTFVPFDRQGRVDPDDVRKALEKDTRLVVVNHASNVLGTVQPVSEIGAICREAGVPLCVDAAQSAGVVPIDMQAMGIDLLAFTGHKSLLGPTGIGGLCVAEGVELTQTRAGGTGVKSASRRHLEEYPFRLEAGTPNVLGAVGLSRGLELIGEQGGPSAICAREMDLAQPLWNVLQDTEGVTTYGADSLEGRTPVFAFNFEGMDPAQAGTRLDVDFDVACRTGLHCAPLVHESLGTAPDGAIRMSIGATTTLTDVLAAAEAIRALAAEIRRGRSPD
jgi:cysteine desulfurase/selenocysteine lyase